MVFASQSMFTQPGNGYQQIYLYDIEKGYSTLVSHTAVSGLGNADSFFPEISADGRYIVYESDAENLVDLDVDFSRDIFRYDVKTATTVLLSPSQIAESPLQYTGAPLDDYSGLTYLKARYYNADIGRFYAMDPVHFVTDDVQSANRYAYANH